MIQYSGINAYSKLYWTMEATLNSIKKYIMSTVSELFSYLLKGYLIASYGELERQFKDYKFK